MRPRTLAHAGLFWIFLALPALAQTELWVQMTAQDLAAAKALISDNHPAAVPGYDHARLIGPFTPSIVYSGRTDDDAAVKAWVREHVLTSRLAEPPPQAGH